ncbi:transmembrane protein 180 isoform X2 [Falco biarmicus]|uniref:transmembrane protein 180 isoform X2 n=1 Tax=Falco cherrug TaxID=345164 RepID=UPI00247AF195|nr:transmembrane protein 180 isoform X2 [Falco cherrug]XP_055656546.1 transmembrane protein 180 isoform X2 [Falco peregrinus]XP_056207422.1 transmembrane protein 180 isoform X2 [Falco biarmicus]
MGLRLLACLFHWPTAVIYGSLSLFVSILHNVFLLYYVDTFVSVYKIDKLSFWIGETVFLIWNSLNDPLFGWLSDRVFLSAQQLCIEKLSVPQEKRITLAEYLQQLSRHRNFLWFVCMNLIQVFHCHFNSNFFPLFLEHLLSDQISVSTGSFLLGVSYIAPHLNNLYFLSLCRRCGVYAVVRGLFFLKLALSVVMLLAGPDQVYLLCIFIASNRVFTEGTCKLLNLVVTDLVDEDLVLNRRKQAASALLFGMVALVTKPGQTFAPLIGTWLLCAYTGYDIFQRNPLSNVVSAQPKLESAAALEPTLRQGCFYLLVFVPITCALLQLLSWSQFSLHGKRLQRVKAQRQSLMQGQAPEVKTI